MFEDNLYEPIAEIYLTLNGQPSFDDIYCLCSRVFVEGANREGEVQEETVEGEVSQETAKPGHIIENSVRFCNSFTESQPVQTPKKTHEEVVSCYCSASHYSTDEHDSLRDSSALHHSDSGADLSESSRDLDWEGYWTLHGERLIWESWITKYGSYVDPSYISPGAQQPADGEEASFCVQSDRFPDPNRKTSFTGVLDIVKTGNDSPVGFSSQKNSVDEDKLDEFSAPKILVESVKSEVDDFLSRRLSDISEIAKSTSERSEDSLNFDDNDKLRLSVYSRCSGSSAPLSATTDSMTNVTHITLSSSDSSYGVDDSSTKSSSILSSSDSANSADQQWQHLWTDHFNEQYYYHFNKFITRCGKKIDCSEEVKSDSGFIVDESKLLSNQQSEPQHQESIDDVGSIETQDSVSECEQSQLPSAPASSISSCKSEQSKKYVQRQRLLSVGYLLQQLKAMSVEPTERIQEEDESLNSLSRPSTMENVRNSSDSAKCAGDEGVPQRLAEVESKCVTGEHTDIVEEGMQDNSDQDCTGVRHGVKRSHEQEHDETSLEKVKSAYQLMGFMFDLENTKKIRKASIWYKKRFSQIRFQNRILRLQKNPNKHIYFDDDDEVFHDNSSQLKKDNTDGIEATNNCEESPENIDGSQLQHEPEIRKLDMEDFSEKDDSSTDDDQDIFFSAEEDNQLDTSQEKRENRLKTLPKRRKKKQLKKKFAINYPEEMVVNPKIKKFWRRRYSLFSKYDEGIRMDAESWYSVTPEKIAINIAERCRCDLVVDAFCGAGGNAIQLAFTCERVIAVDIDPCKIELARHNARLYGVEDRIEFVVGDYLQLAPSLVADVVFLSPPWGGPSYIKQSVFPLSCLQPVSGQQLLEVTSAVTDNIACYLPRNVNTHELVECAGPGGCVEVVQNFLDRELIAVTAYFGELVNTVE